MTQKRIGLYMQKLWLLAIMVISGLSASAQDVNWTVIEPNVEYTVPSMTSAYWKFTAPQSGIVVISGNDGEFPRPYTDETMQTPINYNHNYVDGGQRIDFAMEAGQTFYSSTFSLNSNSKFTLTMGSQTLELTSVTPSENSVFDIMGSGLLVLNFNMTVAIDKATLTCNGMSAEIVGNVNSGGLQFDLKNQLYEWLTNGSITGGEDLVMTITGVRSAANSSVVYGDNGTLTLHFLAPSKPTMLIGQTMPETFLSYWMKDDSKAMITLEFDGPLMTGEQQTAVCELNFGSAEASDFYAESLPVTVDGNTVSVNLSGKLRTPMNMVPSGMNYGSMFVKFYNITAADGTKVFSAGQGQVSAFQFDIPFEEITSDITAEFTPDNGAQLTNVSNILLWISDKTALTYNGVIFEYTQGNDRITKIVDNSQITHQADISGNGEEITIPVPDEAKTAYNVVVSLNEVQYIDGVDHNITCTYNVTNSISDVKVENQNTSIYNLNGYMMTPTYIKGQKGVYIINGKKTIVK